MKPAVLLRWVGTVVSTVSSTVKSTVRQGRLATSAPRRAGSSACPHRTKPPTGSASRRDFLLRSTTFLTFPHSGCSILWGIPPAIDECGRSAPGGPIPFLRSAFIHLVPLVQGGDTVGRAASGKPVGVSGGADSEAPRQTCVRMRARGRAPSSSAGLLPEGSAPGLRSRHCPQGITTASPDRGQAQSGRRSTQC